jgi:hypothetical protein
VGVAGGFLSPNIRLGSEKNATNLLDYNQADNIMARHAFPDAELARLA